MYGLFNINPDVFQDKSMKPGKGIAIPDNAIRLPYDKDTYIVLQSDKVAVCNTYYKKIINIEVFPIEVFTVCASAINDLHIGKILPEDDRYHLDMQADIWKKCPGFERHALKVACEGYAPMDGIICLCNNENRSVYVYMTHTSTVNLKRIRFEVIDYNAGNNANSVGLNLKTYEQICQIVSEM